MKFKGQFQVLGAKGFKGMVEGKQYDSCTLRVVMDVSEKNGTEVGFNVSEMKFGNEEEFQKLRHLPFPIQAELEIELTTKGPEVHGFRALTSSQKAA